MGLMLTGREGAVLTEAEDRGLRRIGMEGIVLLTEARDWLLGMRLVGREVRVHTIYICRGSMSCIRISMIIESFAKNAHLWHPLICRGIHARSEGRSRTVID